MEGLATFWAQSDGVARAVGHGQTSVASDGSASEASSIRRVLFEWLADLGDDVEIRIEAAAYVAE